MCKIASHTLSHFRDCFSFYVLWQLIIHQPRDPGTDGAVTGAGDLGEIEQRDLLVFLMTV